jgi:predicted RNase H-like nuclease (RuvC/YqgF family)
VLIDEYNRVLDGYEKEAVGPLKTKTLCESLKTLQYSLFQSISDTFSTEMTKELSQQVKRQANHEEKEKEYLNRINNLDERLKRFHDQERDLEDECSRIEKLNKEYDAELQEAHSRAFEIK